MGFKINLVEDSADVAARDFRNDALGDGHRPKFSGGPGGCGHPIIVGVFASQGDHLSPLVE